MLNLRCVNRKEKQKWIDHTSRNLTTYNLHKHGYSISTEQKKPWARKNRYEKKKKKKEKFSTNTPNAQTPYLMNETRNECSQESSKKGPYDLHPDQSNICQISRRYA